MEVVIAGAGEVGTHLAKMLSKESHNIVLLDDDGDKLDKIAGQMDLLTHKGMANSINDLKEAGVSKADLFIAVTPYESKNILACILAKELGAKKTIARINNSEYLAKKNKKKFIDLGVDELIYPETLAAKETFVSLKQPGARAMHEFTGGRLVLFAVKIRENSEFVDMSLNELSGNNESFRAVAIIRGDHTIIPHGKDVIRTGDVVYFFSTRKAMPELFILAGKKLFNIKKIMILGGSRIAQKAVEKLGDHFSIRIIDSDRKRCQQIADKYPNVLVINADGRNMDILREENIGQMDAFVSLTGNSETNILSCHLAKKMGVKRTVAEIENLDFICLAEEIGIGSVINKKLIAASFIYRYCMSSQVANVKYLTGTEAEAIELIASPNSKVTKKAIQELDFPKDSKIGGIIRGDKVMIAKGHTQIKEGDRVVVFALPTAIKKIDKYFI